MFERRMGFRSESFFLVASDEAYAQAFRDAGWGEQAIQMELDRLHAFQSQYTRTKPAEPEPESTPEGDDLIAALARSRQRRQGPAPS